MTISLEEHVARAIAKVWTSENKNADIVQAGILFLPSARAAIAAVREREGAECGGAATHSKTEYVQPDPAEAMRAKWPAGCNHPNSCSRNGDCMYAGCVHEGKTIPPSPDAALKGNGEGRVIDEAGRSTPERQGGPSGAGNGGRDGRGV